MSNSWLCCPSGWQTENQRKRKEKRVLARQPKKLPNMKVTVVSIVMSSLRETPKVWVMVVEEWGIGGRTETIQNTAFLWLVRILRRVPKIWYDLLSLKLRERQLTNADVENSHAIKIIRQTTLNKDTWKKEWHRRTRKRFETKLYSRNLIKGVPRKILRTILIAD